MKLCSMLKTAGILSGEQTTPRYADVSPGLRVNWRLAQRTNPADFTPAAISCQSFRWKRAPVQVCKQFLLVKVPTADSCLTSRRRCRGRLGLSCCRVNSILQYLLNTLRM